MVVGRGGELTRLHSTVRGLMLKRKKNLTRDLYIVDRVHELVNGGTNASMNEGWKEERNEGIKEWMGG